MCLPIASIKLNLCVSLLALKVKNLPLKYLWFVLSPPNYFIEFLAINSIEKLVDILDQSLSQPKVKKLEFMNQN
jgi:hypothetical protein